MLIKEKGERVHVLVPGGCTRPLVGGTCASSTPAMAQPQKRIPATSSLLCNSKRQGGGFGGAQIALMYPGRRFLVLELPTPGGLCSQAAIDHPVGPQLFLHNHPPLPGTPQTRQIWQQNWTGRSKPCPNFGRLDQSMQITAPTAIA